MEQLQLFKITNSMFKVITPNTIEDSNLNNLKEVYDGMYAAVQSVLDGKCRTEVVIHLEDAMSDLYKVIHRLDRSR